MKKWNRGKDAHRHSLSESRGRKSSRRNSGDIGRKAARRNRDDARRGFDRAKGGETGGEFAERDGRDLSAEEKAQKSFEKRKQILLKQRRRQSRIRRFKRRIFKLGVISFIVIALFFLVRKVLTLPFFQKGVDASEVEIPTWVEQKFIEKNPYSRPGTELKQVKGIVVHYVGNSGTTAAQNRSYFNSLAQTHKTYASSHFIIGMEGEIIQCIPLTEIAYCSNDRNSDTISIECCHPGEDGKFTEETYSALVQLVKWLCQSFELDSQEDVIRHYDVTGKLCPLYYVENPEAWEQFLRDINEREEEE